MISRPVIRRFGTFVGASPAMEHVFAMVEKAANFDVPVLVAGETGTGKELVAQEIHRRGRRRNAPFVAVNTGALSPELVASELFGHIKGSFTGAVENKMGRFAEADGGTLFLDEIATMEERVQIALLRVLEDGSLRPVGGKTDKTVDVRLIAATNIDLRRAVDAGSFREDLVHRLQVFPIYIPPLRNNLDDLPMLAYHFLELIEDEFGLDLDGISDPVFELLMRYAWPGNRRELKNVLAQAAVMAEEGIILPEHLPARLQCLGTGLSMHEVAWPSPARSRTNLVPSSSPETSSQMEPGSFSREGLFLPMGISLDEVQKAYILKTLVHCSNNKTQAARSLGVSRKTLYDRLLRWRKGAEEAAAEDAAPDVQPSTQGTPDMARCGSDSLREPLETVEP